VRELLLSVDYGQSWPLSDIFWDAEDQVNWDQRLSPELTARLEAWASYFTDNANEETGLFGSEEKRRWFDLEGVKLFHDLRSEVGGQFDVKLDLWF
jgi:hypothetical protein